MLADAQARKITPAAPPNPDGACADSQGIRVVEDDDPVVGGEPQIALDSAAEFERGCESRQAVLGKAGTIMQAPVGEAERTRIERVRL